ncbi:MAG: sodium:calcium antiporter [Planctomyces sp.]|nr:sodium:calcium antiporter [Planctomyces sp.]
MDELILQNITPWPWYFLLPSILGLLLVLGWAADMLVSEAVVLSERAQIPKIVIGATIVSLGTTMPETAVSVFAAIQGQPDLALGNAVGSIICDTGLILGIACLISPLPLPKRIVNRQGWLQLLAGVLLVLVCWPFSASWSEISEGTAHGNMPQWVGFIFLGLLALYLWTSARGARRERNGSTNLEDFEEDASAPVGIVIVKLIIGIVVVLATSKVLIPIVRVAAERMGVPEAVISASLVAFGTSLPELVTCVTAARRGHGELAVGNVVGADILNVLFVTGAAAAVTREGLTVGPRFYTLLFPAMLLILVTFRIGILMSPEKLSRKFGVLLLALYILTMIFLPGGVH